jgi:hypothetical protein
VSNRQIVDDAIHSVWSPALIGDCLALDLPRQDWTAHDVSPYTRGGMEVRLLFQSFLL